MIFYILGTNLLDLKKSPTISLEKLFLYEYSITLIREVIVLLANLPKF